METDTKARGEGKNKTELFGSLKSGIKEIQKQDVWKEITAAGNSVGVDNPSTADVQIFNLHISDIHPVMPRVCRVHIQYITDNNIVVRYNYLHLDKKKEDEKNGRTSFRPGIWSHPTLN